VSFGIQDFDAAVQLAVNRVQSEVDTLRLIERARSVGFGSVSVDLIYGLPKQTPATFRHTLELIVGARPDRLAVYSYAHLPHLFKAQRQIHAVDLPPPAAKLDLLRLTVQTLTAVGYTYVGMDHFATPEDELVQAQRAGTLHRNFQGYSTRAECDLIGLGMSSISKIGDTYAQNAKTLDSYYRAIEAGQLAIDRGVRLTPDDVVRREVIHRLMCATGVDFAEIEATHAIHFEDYFAAELTSLQPLVADGLVDYVQRGLRVSPRGRLLMRNVAMSFDKYLAQPQAAAAMPRFSRAV
jgi:oxygen-independent coproporphyrinogen-3 oxidase